MVEYDIGCIEVVVGLWFVVFEQFWCYVGWCFGVVDWFVCFVFVEVDCYFEIEYVQDVVLVEVNIVGFDIVMYDIELV